MGLRIVLFTAALVTLAGCSAVPLPPEPSAADSAELFRLQVDTVWRDTGLDDSLRPEVAQGEPLDMGEIGLVFARCMMDRDWAAYFADGSSARYRSLVEATSDGERLDWYACFAAHPMSTSGTLGSIAQYDFVYDYYRDFLVPCLTGRGYTVTHSPSRGEFLTKTGADGFLFVPVLWNPYFTLPEFEGANSLPAVEQECPPEPPQQDFYVLQ